MPVDLYVAALIADEQLTDEVWEAWDAGLINNQEAAICWWLLLEYRACTLVSSHVDVLYAISCRPRQDDFNQSQIEGYLDIVMW